MDRSCYSKGGSLEGSQKGINEMFCEGTPLSEYSNPYEDKHEQCFNQLQDKSMNIHTPQVCQNSLKFRQTSLTKEVTRTRRTSRTIHLFTLKTTLFHHLKEMKRRRMKAIGEI
jgi:hypothetical protein